jgi:hypothetical protein
MIERVKELITEDYQDASRDLKRAQMKAIGRPTTDLKREMDVAQGVVIGLKRALVRIDEVQQDNPLPFEKSQ